jgi:regulator of RNase E activity RraA
MDRLGIPGGVCTLRPLVASDRAAGRVRTVKLSRAVPDASRHHAADVIASAGEGDVIVIAGGTEDVGAWGGLLARAAQARSIAAAIVDGACRDADEIASIAFPVWARGTSPRSSRGRLSQIAADVIVSIGDAVVHPGDFVLADATGVVFVPAKHAPAILDEAERIAAAERDLVARIAAGEDPLSLFGANYERFLDERE